MGKEKVFDKIIITDTLEGLGTGRLENCLAHALCVGGGMDFDFNGNHFTIQKGDLIIVRKGRLIENISSTDDFKARVIYIDAGFIEYCTPQSNYGMKGQLALFMNPVIRLNDKQFALCMKDFDSVEYRVLTTGFVFYEESIRCAVQLMILDFFDFHAYNNGEDMVSSQYALIMNRFLAMLENGEYRSNREVTYYASELCVTAKYLSEVCKKTSGHSANFWINRYTILDISRLLSDKRITFVEISDRFGFSSPAYFSRYVQRYLGMRPTDCRE
ncbi:MAG: helix-turn-helix domain-containing protein [Bacteroides sp.]|nr:helix-turn-helix domain-containing protein [Roseburia sp.]MCM1347297.1 helix-turn-helix domain-containing protein [Bacteroides sp.]MCM1419784.1 helix-turn-helix domain-containing protein [Bacteroides sp.]